MRVTSVGQSFGHSSNFSRTSTGRSGHFTAIATLIFGGGGGCGPGSGRITSSALMPGVALAICVSTARALMTRREGSGQLHELLEFAHLVFIVGRERGTLLGQYFDTLPACPSGQH
jgi:hypothetical protein